MILTSRNKTTAQLLLEDHLTHRQICKKVSLRFFQIKSSSQTKTTLFIIVIITETKDELNVFSAKGNNKVYFLQSSIILQTTTEKDPCPFCRESMLKGKTDACCLYD